MDLNELKCQASKSPTLLQVLSVDKIKALEKPRHLQQEMMGYRKKNNMDILNKTGYFIGVFLFLAGSLLFAQEHDHNHDIHHHNHEHPKNEIGLGNYLSYLAGERETAYGLHIHYLRSFEESRFGVGIGYEQIFDEHKHRSLTIIGAYRIVYPLVLSLAPGILFPTEENPGIRFTLHTEIVYEFEIGRFHIGPALEFATTFDEYHIGVGLHVAYAF